jgi:hypothetical protein
MKQLEETSLVMFVILITVLSAANCFQGDTETTTGSTCYCNCDGWLYLYNNLATRPYNNCPNPVRTRTDIPPATKPPIPTPVNTPISTPVKTSFPTSFHTPISTPVKTPIPTPVRSPISSPVKTSIPTSDRTLMSSPAKTPIPTGTRLTTASLPANEKCFLRLGFY